MRSNEAFELVVKLHDDHFQFETVPVVWFETNGHMLASGQRLFPAFEREMNEPALVGRSHEEHKNPLIVDR
jgi:hypothetical protein